MDVLKEYDETWKIPCVLRDFTKKIAKKETKKQLKSKLIYTFAHAEEAANVNLKRIASPQRKTASPLTENNSSITNQKKYIMKKRLYTLLTALYALMGAANAQSFDFVYQGRTLDEGATVAINAGMNDFGELACETNPPTHPGDGLLLKISDASGADASATLTINTDKLNPAMIQWCMGGTCVPFNGLTSKTKTFHAGPTEQVQFDATDIKSEGVLEATLSVTIGGVTKSVDILFTHNPTETWLDYFNKEDIWYVTGSLKAERYNVAAYVPYDYIGGKDISINGLSLYFLNSDVTDIEYWVSTTLPEFGGNADLETVKLPASELKLDDYNELNFKESHVIPQGGLYVGYSFTISALNEQYSVRPISYRYSDNTRTDGFYYSTTSKPEWQKNEGDLMVSLKTGGQFNANAVSIKADDPIYTYKDTQSTLDVTLCNCGITPVKSIRYAIETEGKSVASGTCRVSIEGMTSEATVSIPLPVESAAGIYPRNITITEVNSQLNESEANQTLTHQCNLMQKLPFMPLFEEFTGTWCGWCVRGIVAMEKAQKKYGDRAAIIAVHDDNAMGTEDYLPILNKFCDAFPSGVVNRSVRTSIGTNTVTDFIESTLDTPTPATITAEACWADAEQTKIKVDTKTTFQLDMNGHFAIAYVLTADGLTGTGSDWAQENFYSGSSDSDPDLQYWCSQPDVVTGVVFDHVAVAAWEPQYGVEGSVESHISAGVPQTYSYTADISGNTIIQDKSKLKMIAMLLNAETGKYINAGVCPIKAYDPSAIDGIYSPSQQATGRYSLDGQKLNAPRRGVNIIRMNDGTIKKVLVK